MQNALCTTSYHPTTDELLLPNILSEGRTAKYALNQYDVSAKSHELRLQNMCSRGRMVETLRTVFSRSTITDVFGNQQDPWLFLVTPALAWFLRALRGYYTLGSQVLQSERSLDGLMVPRKLFERQLSWTEARWSVLGHDLPDVSDEEFEKHQSLEYPWPEFRVDYAAPGPDTPPRGIVL